MSNRKPSKGANKSPDGVIHSFAMRCPTMRKLREGRVLLALVRGHADRKLATYNEVIADALARSMRANRRALLSRGMTAAEIEAALVAAGVRETGEGRSKAEQRAAMPDESAPVPRVD
jgi:hypothetical protein